MVYGGGLAQVGKQAAGVGVTIVWSIVVTVVLLKVVDLIVGQGSPTTLKQPGSI